MNCQRSYCSMSVIAACGNGLAAVWQTDIAEKGRPVISGTFKRILDGKGMNHRKKKMLKTKNQM